MAGILVWEGELDDVAEEYYPRRVDAASFLGDYTSWCNGECYCYHIEDVNGNDMDFCGGFIGAESLKRSLEEEHPEALKVDREGDFAYVLG